MSRPLLVVDRCYSEAAQLAGSAYDVLPYEQADSRTLHERDVLYWPSGKGGSKRAQQLIGWAHTLRCIVANGNTAADFLVGTWADFVAWAKPRVIEVRPGIALDAVIPAPKPTALTVAQLVEQYGLAVSPKGQPYCNAANVARFLHNESSYKGHIWYDDFTAEIMTDLTGRLLGWTDSKTNDLMVYMQSKLGLQSLNERHVSAGVQFFAEQDRRHQVRDWLAGLIWDGTQRISNFFPVYFGAPSTAAVHAFGSNFWVMMVRRALQPGCQADYMVVLEGDQGIGKTNAFRVIGGDWYGEVGITADSEEFERQLQGRILVEVSELHSFTRADQARIKQIITKTNDIYREKYGKFALNHLRQGILVGTTNETEWIKDQTGGRRFWPVHCGSIDIPALKRDREQLFAEAVVRAKEGDEGYHVPPEVVELQEERREHDVWEQALKDKLLQPGGTLDRITLLEAMGLLGIRTENLTGRDARRVANSLKRIGYNKNVVRIRGELCKMWVRNTE